MLQADGLAQQGQAARAVAIWQQVLLLEPEFPPALNQLGHFHLQRGEYQAARDCFERAIAREPKFAMPHAGLSRLHSATGNPIQALASINRAIVAEPAAWGPHMEKARLLEEAGRLREAARSWSRTFAYVPEQARRNPALKAQFEHGERLLRQTSDELRTHLQATVADLTGNSERRALQRFEGCLDIITGRREFVTARPLVLPFPQLPAIPYFDTDQMPWVPLVQAAFPDILGELGNVLDQDRGFVPYVQTPAGNPAGQFQALDHNLDWGAYFLWKNGRRIDAHADACLLTERTLLDHAPLNTIPNRAPVAFFSALKPHVHIPPHTGATNTRLTAHLPLIVPPDSALRVGGEVHVWQPGQIVLFDDTIVHEAWNYSDRLRVVMIFDVWNPLLTDLEKSLIARTTEGMIAFYGEDSDLGEL